MKLRIFSRKGLVITGLLIAVVGIAILFATRNPLQNRSPLSDGTPTDNSTAETEPTPPDSAPAPEFTLNGWIPDWGQEAGVASVKALKTENQKWEQISPMWYVVDANGNLSDKRGKFASEITKQVKSKNLSLVPTIAMFDHEIFSKLTAVEGGIEAHAKKIIELVEKNNYDGIDLDYESIKLVDAEAYYQLINQISAALKPQGKLTSVTVLAKWEGAIAYPYAPQTRQVQDWRKLSEIADQIRIMAYDFTHIKAPQPGPIAPLDWQYDVLELALKEISAEKIYLGLHLYSYEWWQPVSGMEKLRKQSEYVSPLEFNPEAGESLTPAQQPSIEPKPVRSYTYSTVKGVISGNKGEEFDYQGEQVFKYIRKNSTTGVNEERVLVYIDPAGLKQRVDQAKQKGVAGVYFWRLGGEADILEQLET